MADLCFGCHDIAASAFGLLFLVVAILLISAHMVHLKEATLRLLAKRQGLGYVRDFRLHSSHIKSTSSCPKVFTEQVLNFHPLILFFDAAFMVALHQHLLG